jgi:hypothetical protein
MSALLNYQEEVRDAILNRNGDPILNSTVEHASLITQEAFLAAQHQIRILSSRLDASCYAKAGVVGAAKAFLASKGHVLRLLVEAQNVEWKKHPLIMELSNELERLKIRTVPPELASRYSFNMLLLDDYGYRLESDRARPAAVAVFYPENSEKPQMAHLERIFEDIWDESIPVVLN